MKLNKAVGGVIIPQHLVYGVNVLLPFIRKLFNRLFLKGEFPKQWTKTVVIPLYKKGSVNDPNNYRGIALLDVLSKVYIAIITKRLTFYLNAYCKICEAQAGFRSGYCTVDNAFILQAIVSKYLCMKRKTLYVAFIDFQKAFDSVDHNILYDILRKGGIKGNLYNAIQSIYISVKACVKTNNGVTDCFECPIGLRQGCNLSPIMFALFIDELYSLLCKNRTRGIQLFPHLVEIFFAHVCRRHSSYF